MRRNLRILLFLALLAALCQRSVLAAEPTPLSIGIMPFNSALALLRTHQPLREFMQQRLQRPVELYTSSDYFAYLKEVTDQRFDMLVAGPHFAVMAADKGYIPLYRYRAVLQPLIVVRADSAIKDVADLRGKRIGLSSRLSISSIGGARWLQEQGLQMGTDYPIFERATHGAAIAGVAVGDLDAALTTFTPLNQVPPDIRAQVRILPTEIHVPHLMTVSHSRLGEEEIERIRQALYDFSENSPEGQAFFKATGYLGYEPVSDADMQTMRPYIELTHKMMGLSD